MRGFGPIKGHQALRVAPAVCANRWWEQLGVTAFSPRPDWRGEGSHPALDTVSESSLCTSRHFRFLFCLTPNAVVLSLGDFAPRGHLATSGESFHCQPVTGCSWHLGGGVGGRKQPAMRRTVAHNKE